MLKAIVGTTSSVNPPTSSTFTKLVLPDDCKPTTETSSAFVQNNDVNQVHQDENNDAIRNKGYRAHEGRGGTRRAGSGGRFGCPNTVSRVPAFTFTFDSSRLKCPRAWQNHSV